MESESNMVPDPAHPHTGQSFRDHFKGTRIAGTVLAAQEEKQPVGRGKFRFALESPKTLIEIFSNLFVGLF